MNTDKANACVLFAGGGTGGHIFPNLAVVERLREMGVAVEPHFLVSTRPLDGEILRQARIEFTGLVVKAWSSKPRHWPGFLRAWFAAKRQVRGLIRQKRVAAIVATGGFVSGPAIVAGKAAGAAVVLVNLDAVPGKANRRMAGHADKIFSAYVTPDLPGAEIVGMPLRRAAIGPDDVAEARMQLELDPHRRTLFITGGSQGAQSINGMMVALVQREAIRRALDGWQILHICGPNNETGTRRGYAEANIAAQVHAFCDRMGAAWRSATLAISRAGAGSVAEAWANATPTLFFPYPMHKDEHQRLNAKPMVDTGGAILVKDRIDPAANADAIADTFASLLNNATQLDAMRAKLAATKPPDGAERIAKWLHAHIIEASHVHAGL